MLAAVIVFFIYFIYLNKGNEGQLTASDTCLYIIEKCCGKNIKMLENTEKKNNIKT
jgi:hypothetical protein